MSAFELGATGGEREAVGSDCGAMGVGESWHGCILTSGLGRRVEGPG